MSFLVLAFSPLSPHLPLTAIGAKTRHGQFGIEVQLSVEVAKL
jgi:hypothetical protein